MWTFHPAASSLANFNDAISTISTTRLFIYISCSHWDKNQRLSWHHSSHSLKIPRWTSSQHWELSGSFYLPCTLSCTRAIKEASWFWGCCQILPFSHLFHVHCHVQSAISLNFRHSCSCKARASPALSRRSAIQGFKHGDTSKICSGWFLHGTATYTIGDCHSYLRSTISILIECLENKFGFLD